MPFILITVLIDMLGIGLVIPVMPKLVTEMYGKDISSGSLMFGWIIAVYALMQFIFSPVLGNLSDRFGRRPIILLSLLGAGLDYVFMAFAPTLGWLFVGRIVGGITGASITAANAYIADVSPPEKRARNFGMIGACFGVGFILGPAAGGALAHFGLRAPFVAAAGLTLLNALYGYFVLPESLPASERRAFDFRRANPLSSLGALRRYPVVFGLIGVIALERLAHDALPATWVLYLTYRFSWSELQIGLSLALVGVVYAVVQGGMVGPLVNRWGESKALLIGLCVQAVTYTMYGFATQGWMIYAIMAMSGLGGLTGPSVQSIMTRRVPADEQGALQGAVTSVHAIMAVFGPLLATNLFGLFTSASAPAHLPGAAFLASALLVAVAAVFAIRSVRTTNAADALISEPSAATQEH